MERRITRTKGWTDVVVYSQAGNGQLKARAAVGEYESTNVNNKAYSAA